MNEKANYFTNSDAWVLACLFWSFEKEGKIDLTELIARGDMLNHAIIMSGEFKDAFYKAQKKGLISIEDRNVVLSDQAIEIREKIKNGKGGLFSIIEKMAKRLNSPRLKLEEIEEKNINKCAFLTEENIEEAYKKYKNTNF